MSLALDVVTFGEAMVMLIAAEPGPLESVREFSKRTAGAETNVAIGLARLGMKVGWASRLGADSMGRYLLAEMQAEGVDCSRVVVDPQQRTGMQFKGRVTDGSDPLVEYHREGSAASQMRIEDIDEAWLRGARHLHATGVFAALSPSCLDVSYKTMRLMRDAGKTVSFDPNLRPSLWPSIEQMRKDINHLAFEANWVLPGLEEGRLLTGRETPEAIASYYRELGAELAVVKLGADGAYYDGVQGRGFVPAFPVPRVVDTVGAGDGFAVGLISAILEGRNVLQAVRRGAWIGARMVERLGDTEGLPTARELQQAGL
jgi:2-dehydro-3-deoxygluconokinase